MTEATAMPSAPRGRHIVGEALGFFLRPHAMRAESSTWKAQIRPLSSLLALNLGVLFLLLPLLIVWTRSVGIEAPRMMRDIPEALVIVMAVLILPPLEEIVFRGWMTGRPRALLALGAILLAGLLVVAQHAAPFDSFAPAIPVAALALAAIMVAAAWRQWRRDAPPRWFSRHFRWIFWGSTILFASAHYSNYPELTLWHVPVVLPQFWSGLVFGFTRLRFGLLRSTVLHCLSNALVLLAFLAFGIPSA